MFSNSIGILFNLHLIEYNFFLILIGDYVFIVLEYWLGLKQFVLFI